MSSSSLFGKAFQKVKAKFGQSESEGEMKKGRKEEKNKKNNIFGESDKIKEIEENLGEIDEINKVIEENANIPFLKSRLAQKYKSEEMMVSYTGGKTGLGQLLTRMLKAVEQEDVVSFEHYCKLYKKNIDKFRKEYEDYKGDLEYSVIIKGIYGKRKKLRKETYDLFQDIKNQKTTPNNKKKVSELYERFEKQKNEEKESYDLLKKLLIKPEKTFYYDLIVKASELLDGMNYEEISEIKAWEEEINQFSKTKEI